MPKPLYAGLYVLLIFSLYSCTTSKNIANTYRSNFAVLGFFGTKIKLKTDSTFEYVFRGDLMYDSATGSYRIQNRKVYFQFNKEVPDLNSLLNCTYCNWPLKKVLINKDTIHYQMFCYIGNKKLFPAHDESGKKVTKAFGYSKRRKYLLFGSHYHNRRYFYRRVE